MASLTKYHTNNLNQCTAEGSFRPTFDADGNQTLIKTSTGTWNVTYNAKNRPVRFEKADSSIVVECTYDTMGRRATKKVTTNGTLTEHRRFLYRGYLQIACCDLTRAYTPALWFITWDPTQPTATRPLAIQKNGTWYTYGWDLTKNICETYRTDARIDLAYTYTPYGEVSPAHAYDQPLRWTSEYHDVESPRGSGGGLDKHEVFAPQGRAPNGVGASQLGLHYYNYRHYNPAMGRWLRRDDLQESQAGHNRFTYNLNNLFLVDKLGLYSEAGSMLLFSYYMVNPIPGRFLPGKEKRFENFEGKVVDIETLLPGISHELLDAIVHFHDIPEKVKNGINEEINKRVTARALIFNEFSGYDKFSDYTSNSYRFERVLFALGGGRVRTEYEVMYNWCSLHSGTNVAYEWNTHLNIYYSDVFIEPFYTEFSFIKIGIRNLEIGNPFGYVHQWTDHESIYMSDRGFITYSL